MNEDDPRRRVAEVKRLAREGGLHGESLGDTVNDAHPSVRVETLMAFDGQPLRVADFKIIHRIEDDPNLDVRTLAEPTLLRL